MHDLLFGEVAKPGMMQGIVVGSGKEGHACLLSKLQTLNSAFHTSSQPDL